MELGIEILLDTPDSFLLIKETLTRIGICSQKNKTLYQSVHLLHKQGRYYIMHFKEMFILDKRPSNITEEDLNRRNIIVNLLHDWGLFTLVGNKKVDVSDPSMISKIKVIPFKDKQNWTLVQKYTIGVKHE